MNIANNRIIESLKERYHRRWTQYTRTGKIALCCIAKKENEYIRFFVEYYKALCFDKIFIYDNNDPDNERFEEVINDYIQSGFVDIVDYRGKKVAQLSAYQDCYEKYNKEYSWMAFFDIDEFFTFADGTKDIHKFLLQWKFLPFQLIHVNWMVYGDNELLDNDGRNVTERFVNPIVPFNFIPPNSTFPENNHVKTIIRGGLPFISWRETPHTPVVRYYRCCQPDGYEVSAVSPLALFDNSIAYLRHYSTKTIGEWIRNKMKRGIPDRDEQQWKDTLDIDFFFRFNKRTEEKMTYVQEYMNANK